MNIITIFMKNILSMDFFWLEIRVKINSIFIYLFFILEVIGKLLLLKYKRIIYYYLFYFPGLEAIII